MAEPIAPEPPPPVNRATIVGVGLFVTALAVLLVFFVPDAQPKVAPEERDPAKIFAQNCAICHGLAGEGKEPYPKIRGTAKTEKEILDLLETGSGQMPSFRALSPDHRELLAKWVKELKP